MTESDLRSLERTAEEIRWTPSGGGDPDRIFCCFSRSGFANSLVDASTDRDDVRLFDLTDVVGALTTS